MSEACVDCAGATRHVFNVETTARYEYRRCRSCGAVFSYPRPSEEDLAKLYGDEYFSNRGQFGYRDYALGQVNAPRVLACALALPFLTVVLDASAVLGGLAAEVLGGTLSAQTYGEKSLVFLRLSDVVPATLKTAVFGLIIGLVGCWTGRNAERSTEAVGRAATRGVVRATVAVFVADVLLVPWVQAGMAALGWAG